MGLNLNEAIARMRKAGGSNLRAVPMEGQDVQTGQYKIEANEGGWTTLIEGIPRKTATDLITQACNRVICG